MFTDEQKQQILDDALQSAKQRIVDEAIGKVSWAIQIAVEQQVKVVVTDWVENELKPEIVTRLSSEKAALIDAAFSAGSEISEALTKTLVAKAIENMSQSYKRKAIIESLFN